MLYLRPSKEKKCSKKVTFLFRRKLLIMSVVAKQHVANKD